jgi:hypothetical protein
VAQKREGTILVHQFTDSRSENKKRIGNKRIIFGIPFGSFVIKDRKPVDVAVTELFAEALTHAGYEVITQPAGSSTNDNTNVTAVLRGDIKDFWLDMFAATWHDVSVDFKLSDKNDKQVVWEKTIQGDNINPLWLGLKSEFQKVIRQSLDEALNKAATEFASDEFYQKVKGTD